MKSIFKVFDAPYNLRGLIASVRQRHDHMVVGLSQCGTVSGKAFPAFPVGFKDRFIHTGGMHLQPGQERGTEVEADLAVIVHDFNDLTLLVQYAGGRIGRVAFRGDALVPVMIRESGILKFDGFQPCIFTRRLIKVTMDADKAVHHRNSLPRPSTMKA